MAIDYLYVQNVAPELSSETQARIEFFIAQASNYINRKIWGSKADYAHALFTAHLMLSGSSTTGGGSGGGSGVVSQEKVGDLSTSYAVSSVTPGTTYATTRYGALFEELMRTLLTSPWVVS